MSVAATTENIPCTMLQRGQRVPLQATLARRVDDVAREPLFKGMIAQLRARGCLKPDQFVHRGLATLVDVSTIIPADNAEIEMRFPFRWSGQTLYVTTTDGAIADTYDVQGASPYSCLEQHEHGHPPCQHHVTRQEKGGFFCSPSLSPPLSAIVTQLHIDLSCFPKELSALVGGYVFNALHIFYYEGYSLRESSTLMTITLCPPQGLPDAMALSTFVYEPKAFARAILQKTTTHRS